MLMFRDVFLVEVEVFSPRFGRNEVLAVKSGFAELFLIHNRLL